MPQIKKYSGKTLSRFAVRYEADNFFAVRSEAEAIEALKLAKASGLETVCLGGGSNVFFASKKIKSFVLKNEIPAEVEYLGGDRFRVSSSVPMIKLLRGIHSLGRDCFYYLASAPCQIGGAVAMNAGSGPKEGLSISDVIESVDAADENSVKTYAKSELGFGYRNSIFLREPTRFITSAVFVFPRRKMRTNPITERLEWARTNQDLGVPNCGSLCNKYNAGILKFVRAAFKFCPAGLSKKKLNWAYNLSENPIWLAAMLKLIKVLHKFAGKELKFELRIYK